MSVKLYHFPISNPSRGAFLAAKLLNVPVELVIIDLFKKEHLSDSFIKINPQHCVPTLKDGDFVLWESRAIACYLADKYGQNDDHYPKDLQRRAIINSRLYFDNSFLYARMGAICYPIIFDGVTEIKQKLKDDMNVSLGFLNQFLEGQKWVAGENPTIADTAIMATLSTIIEIDWDMTQFPNIQRWYKDCSTLPGYKENSEGAKAFAALVNNNLK